MSSMKMKIAAQKKEAAKKRAAANPPKTDMKNPIAAARRMAQQAKSNKGGAANPEDQIQALLMQMFQESYKKYLEDIKGTEEKPMPFEEFAKLAYAQMMQMAQQQGGNLAGLDGEDPYADLPVGSEETIAEGEEAAAEGEAATEEAATEQVE